MAFIIFRNRKVLALAFSQTEAELLVSEAQAAEGVIANVKFRIVKVESADFIENIVTKM
jgi:hypothetical protein